MPVVGTAGSVLAVHPEVQRLLEELDGGRPGHVARVAAGSAHQPELARVQPRRRLGHDKVLNVVDAGTQLGQVVVPG